MSNSLTKSLMDTSCNAGDSLLQILPHTPTRKHMPGDRIRLHLDAHPRQRRRAVVAALDDAGVKKMLVEMINIFGQPILQGAADADEIEDCFVLDVFAEPDPSSMRTDGDAELR